MPNPTEMSANNAAPTSALKLRSGKDIPRSTDNESRASASLASDQNDGDTADIRIGKLDADSLDASKAILRRRFQDKAYVRGSKFYGKMTTYRVNAIGVHPGILSVNRQTYLEASRNFYSENRFNLVRIMPLISPLANDTLIPFLEDRSEGSRRLIKHVEYCYFLTEIDPLFYDPLYCAHLSHVFEETCSYLSQALQLEHVTISFFALSTKELYSHTAYKEYLLNLDKQSWVQRLVPLVKNLDSFRVTLTSGNHDNLVYAAQTYLESKMDKASKKLRQAQIVHGLAHDPAASEE